MDYKKVDKVVETFIDHYKKIFNLIQLVVEYSKKIYLEKNPYIDNVQWSRNIDINDSINIVYAFFKSIDLNMANQFLNLINAKDETGKLYVNFLPAENYENSNSYVDKKGYVYIYFENSPKDAFVIIHELLHKMNDYDKISETGENIETITYLCFKETVSIVGEMLLGEYMIKNGIIVEDDLNVRKNMRYTNSHDAADNIIFENELIKLKLYEKEITYDNIANLLNEYDKDSIEYQVVKKELERHRWMNLIEDANILYFIKAQAYVIAQHFMNDLINRETAIEDFLKIHYAVGSIDSNVNEIFREIMLRKDINVK